MTQYLTVQGLDSIFEFVQERYAKIEEVPAYKDEPGFEKFCGVLVQVQSDNYYPTVFDKAVYLVLNINKGHFFSNGNKRLALVIMISFLAINGFGLRAESKEWYRNTLEDLFPEYKQWEDFDEFTSTDFATYNLSIMIADSGVYGITHDELKRRITAFLEESTER